MTPPESTAPTGARAGLAGHRGAAPSMQTAAAALDDTGDLAVHLATSTVLERCPHPLNELEVAVVLETCGYSRSRVRAAGAQSLMALAKEVYDLVPVYSPGTSPPAAPALLLRRQERRREAMSTVATFFRGLMFAAPMLVSLSTMVVAGVSFWSSNVELSSVASSVTLCACLSLLCTGPFIYAFVRRASFYMAFGDRGMLAYVTRRALGTGMLVATAACTTAYALSTGLGGAPPAAGRLGLAAGIAIAALQVGLCPFYLRNTLVPMLVVVGGGGAVLTWHAVHLGAFTDPVTLTAWQVRLVASMGAMTWLIDAFWLLRGSSEAHGGVHRQLWLPAGGAVARAVAPYGAFGLAYFGLVALPQLVSGGAWLGRYDFNGPFSVASGLALVALLPVAGFGNVAAHHLTHKVLPATLAQERVRAIDRARTALLRHWRAQIATAAAAGMAAAATVDVALPALAGRWLEAHGMTTSAGLLYVCSAGFFFLSIGSFASQLLFGLSSPARSVTAALSGMAVLLVVSGVFSVTGWATLAYAAALGFAAGSGAFAALALIAGEKAFSNVDYTCYRAL